MGSKKSGISDVENGKELYISLGKVEDPQKESRTSREKISIGCYINSLTTVTITNDKGEELFSETIDIKDGEKGDQHLHIVIANAIVGNGYTILIESENGILKKKLFFQPTR